MGGAGRGGAGWGGAGQYFGRFSSISGRRCIRTFQRQDIFGYNVCLQRNRIFSVRACLLSKFVARARKKRSAFVRLVFHLEYSTSSKVIVYSTFVYNITETLSVTNASVILSLFPSLSLSISLALSFARGWGTRGGKPQGEHEKRK